MTKKKVKVSFTGLMVESTKVVGKTVNNMESAPIPLLAVRRSKVSGKKEKDFTGSRTNETNFTDFTHTIFKIY